MTLDEQDKAELLDKMIRRCNKIIRECDQALLDVASLDDMHSGDRAWMFLKNEKGWWQRQKETTYATLAQLNKHRSSIA